MTAMFRTLTIHLTAALSLLAACTDEPIKPEPADPQVLDVIERRLAPRPRTFTIDGRGGGAIAGDSVRFSVAAGEIVDGAGAPVAGPVEIRLRELKGPGDMLRAGRPTVAADGTILESGGAFDLEAFDGAGQPVVIRRLDEVVFRNPADRARRGMEAWVAGPAADVWARPAREPTLATLQGNDYLFGSMPFGMIGDTNAANCDRIANLSNDHMTLKIALEPPYLASAGVFFLPDGASVAAKLYTKDLALPGFVSYANTMPVGITGKLVVVAMVAGQYYLYHDDAYTIPTGSPGAGGVKEATLAITPLAVTEADFMTYVGSL